MSATGDVSKVLRTYKTKLEDIYSKTLISEATNKALDDKIESTEALVKEINIENAHADENLAAAARMQRMLEDSMRSNRQAQRHLSLSLRERALKVEADRAKVQREGDERSKNCEKLRETAAGDQSEVWSRFPQIAAMGEGMSRQLQLTQEIARMKKILEAKTQLERIQKQKHKVAHEIQAAMERNRQTSALAEQMVQQKRAEERQKNDQRRTEDDDAERMNHQERIEMSTFEGNETASVAVSPEAGTPQPNNRPPADVSNASQDDQSTNQRSASEEQDSVDNEVEAAFQAPPPPPLPQTANSGASSWGGASKGGACSDGYDSCYESGYDSCVETARQPPSQTSESTSTLWSRGRQPQLGGRVVSNSSAQNQQQASSVTRVQRTLFRSPHKPVGKKRATELPPRDNSSFTSDTRGSRTPSPNQVPHQLNRNSMTTQEHGGPQQPSTSTPILCRFRPVSAPGTPVSTRSGDQVTTAASRGLTPKQPSSHGEGQTRGELDHSSTSKPNDSADAKKARIEDRDGIDNCRSSVAISPVTSQRESRISIASASATGLQQQTMATASVQGQQEVRTPSRPPAKRTSDGGAAATSTFRPPVSSPLVSQRDNRFRQLTAGVTNHQQETDPISRNQPQEKRTTVGIESGSASFQQLGQGGSSVANISTTLESPPTGASQALTHLSIGIGAGVSGNSTGRQEAPNQTNNPLSQETRGSGSTDNVVDSIGSQLQQQSANSGFGGRLFNFGASTSGFGFNWGDYSGSGSQDNSQTQTGVGVGGGDSGGNNSFLAGFFGGAFGGSNAGGGSVAGTSSGFGSAFGGDGAENESVTEESGFSFIFNRDTNNTSNNESLF